MSLNRRRWSNKFIEAMREFLSREETETADSLVEKATMSTTSSSDTHYTDVTSTMNSPTNLISLKSESSSAHDSDFALAFDNFDEMNKNEASNKINLNVMDDHSVSSNSDYMNTTLKSNASNVQTSANAVLDENISSARSSIDLIQFNETLNLDAQSTEIKSVKSLFDENFKQNDQNNFSSPEFQINKIDQPDVWDALIALEQELSPFDEREKTSEKQEQDFPQILSRLSQKFKETPTKFTEKLVSIIEDSIVSLESPSKPNVADASGISLNRMTGEFRKLCKFIDDESMPEWAPSLMNMTTLNYEKNKTPDKEKHGQKINKTIFKSPLRNIDGIGSPTSQKVNCKLLDNLATPKSKIKSNVESPIKKFTPSADKSFEYWEKVCNMMCDNQSSGKKKVRKSISIPESTKRNLSEMLTICERQMASLDDSTIDVRNSEPCKKAESELKIDQIVRSKSESRIYMNRSIEKIQSPYGKICQSEIKEWPIKKHKSVDSALESNADVSLKENIESEDEIEESYEEILSDNNSDNMEDDQDNSLLIELAKRRQRCLDTAKLMMEIDQEDPNTSSDNKCLETLYKLGVQDKTLIEDKDDVKFFNTLGHCLEYKKYFHDKSKPLLDILQNIHSPDDLKIKKTAAVKSKNPANKSKLNTPALNHRYQQQKPRVMHHEQKHRLTSLKNEKMTVSKPTTRNCLMMSQKSASTPSRLKATPCTEKKTLPLSNLQRSASASSHLRATPCAEKKTLPLSNSQKSISTPSHFRTPYAEKKNLPLSNSQKVKTTTVRPTMQKITPKPHQQNPPTIRKNILHQQQHQQLQQQHVQRKKVSSPVLKTSKSHEKIAVEQFVEELSPEVSPKRTPSTVNRSSEKKATPETPKTMKLHTLNANSPICAKNDNDDPSSPNWRASSEFPQVQRSASSEMSPKSRFFFTPGKSPSISTLGRKKPLSYFSDFALNKPVNALNPGYDAVKSPINMYIHGMDNDLIQNVKGRTEDFLLTPISKQEKGKSPRLKVKLSPSKENKSPFINCNEKKISTVRYQSADKIHLIDDKLSYSPCSLTPNSRTKKLLEPIENTVVIRHEGRVIEYNPTSDQLNSETSIRVQRMAEKMTTIEKRK